VSNPFIVNCAVDPGGALSENSAGGALISESMAHEVQQVSAGEGPSTSSYAHPDHLQEVGHMSDSLVALGILNGVVQFERKEDGWMIALDQEKVRRARQNLYQMPGLHLAGRQSCDRCGAGLAQRCFEVITPKQEGLILICSGCEESSSTLGVNVKETPSCADDCLWGVLEEAATKNVREFVAFPATPEVTKCNGTGSLECDRQNAAKLVHKWMLDVVKASSSDNEALLGLPVGIQHAVGSLKGKDVNSNNLKKIRDDKGRYLTLSMDQVPKNSPLGAKLHQRCSDLQQHLGQTCVNKDIMIFVMTDNFDAKALQGTAFHLDQGWGGNLLLGFEDGNDAPHALWLFLRITTEEEHKRLEKAVEGCPSLKKKFPKGMFPNIFLKGGKVVELGDSSVQYRTDQLLTVDEMQYLQSACGGIATVKEQRPGEIMIVPPGNIHTVTTMHPCVKIAYNWLGSSMLLLAAMHYMVACRLLGPLSCPDYMGLGKQIEESLVPLRAFVRRL